MATRIEDMSSGYFEKSINFDYGISHIIKVNGDDKMAHEVFEGGVIGKIRNVYHVLYEPPNDDHGRKFYIDFLDRYICIDIQTNDDVERYLTIRGSLNYNTRYDCFRTDFELGKYRFVFENTTTGEQDDLIISVDMNTLDKRVFIRVAIDICSSLFVSILDK
jgi:hypothetical protein